ncbi:uncharacterized protein [Macrobrachium rosenbergii]|uniref:uncharacterized protein n=1 Tax=Macrobrachium rosenbergii TaxID=79674 RepID=UPI0034D69E82
MKWIEGHTITVPTVKLQVTTPCHATHRLFSVGNNPEWTSVGCGTSSREKAFPNATLAAKLPPPGGPGCTRTHEEKPTVHPEVVSRRAHQNILSPESTPFYEGGQQEVLPLPEEMFRRTVQLRTCKGTSHSPTNWGRVALVSNAQPDAPSKTLREALISSWGRSLCHNQIQAIREVLHLRTPCQVHTPERKIPHELQMDIKSELFLLDVCSRDKDCFGQRSMKVFLYAMSSPETLETIPWGKRKVWSCYPRNVANDYLKGKRIRRDSNSRSNSHQCRVRQRQPPDRTQVMRKVPQNRPKQEEEGRDLPPPGITEVHKKGAPKQGRRKRPTDLKRKLKKEKEERGRRRRRRQEDIKQEEEEVPKTKVDGKDLDLKEKRRRRRRNRRRERDLPLSP